MLWRQLTSYCGLRRGSAALRALRRLGRSKGQSSSFVSSGSSASASAMARAAHGGSIIVEGKSTPATFSHLQPSRPSRPFFLDRLGNFSHDFSGLTDHERAVDDICIPPATK
jgi:hypothetical protein